MTGDEGEIWYVRAEVGGVGWFSVAKAEAICPARLPRSRRGALISPRGIVP